MLRIVSELLHPLAQLRHMHVQVLRRLNIRHPSILDQAHRLKLELSRKLTPLHDPPPAPSKHLTRCLRNRVQASFKLCDLGHILTRAGLQTKSMWWAVRPDQWSKLFLKVFEPKKRAA